MLLDIRAPGVGMNPSRLFMIEVLACHPRRRLVADGEPACVTGASERSSGAPAPPILVGTQPGSTEFDRTRGQRRATANAKTTSSNLLSE